MRPLLLAAAVLITGSGAGANGAGDDAALVVSTTREKQVMGVVPRRTVRLRAHLSSGRRLKLRVYGAPDPLGTRARLFMRSRRSELVSLRAFDRSGRELASAKVPQYRGAHDPCAGSARGGLVPRIVPDRRMLEYKTRIAGERTRLSVNWSGRARLSGPSGRESFCLATDRLRSLRQELRARRPSGSQRSRDRTLRDLLYRTRRPRKDASGPLREVPPTWSLTVWPKHSRSGRSARPVSDRNRRFVRRLDRLASDLRREHAPGGGS